MDDMINKLEIRRQFKFLAMRDVARKVRNVTWTIFAIAFGGYLDSLITHCPATTPYEIFGFISSVLGLATVAARYYSGEHQRPSSSRSAVLPSNLTITLFNFEMILVLFAIFLAVQSLALTLSICGLLGVLVVLTVYSMKDLFVEPEIGEIPRQSETGIILEE